MQAGTVRTAIVALTFIGVATEVRAQAAAPVSIPLEYWNGAEKLAINVGINGGAPKPYVFDTGSPVFNAVYNPSWWPGLPANPNANNAPSSSLPTNAQFCLGGSTTTFCRGYTGNLVQVPLLTFYKTTSDATPAATLNASPGYVVNAAYNYGVNAGPPPVNATLPFDKSPLDGHFFGTFGAGNFATNVEVVSDASGRGGTPSGYFAGGVLGQTLVAGVTQGYVVAANGQKNPVSSVNGPQQINGINVTIGGQAGQRISACSPCVTVGLTPQMLGQFWAAPPASAGTAGVVPWARTGPGTFPNPYGGAVGNNSSVEMGTYYQITLTKPGGTTRSIGETNLGLLDSGTPDLNLHTAASAAQIAEVSKHHVIDAGVVLTIDGKAPGDQAIAGLTTTTETLTRHSHPVTYNGTLKPAAPGTVRNTIGISFFLQNSVLYDLTDKVIGYTPFFVTDAALATTAGGPLVVDGTNVKLGLAGVVSGAGGVTINPGGVVQLSATNSYAGLTTIKGGGMLYISGPGSIAASSGVSNNGVLDISRAWSPVAIQALTGSGPVRLGGQSLIVTNANGLYSGTISDYGDFPGSGGRLGLTGGALILSGANTYTGGTVVSGGAALGVFADSGLGHTSGGLTLSGGALAAMASFSSARAMTMGAGGGLFDTNGFDVALGTPVSGVGGLTKTGAGTLTLAGANDYAGGTMLAGGTLALAPGASLSPFGALAVNPGTILDLNGNSLTVGPLSGGGTIALGSGKLIANQSATTTLGSVITGTGGLTMAGTGTLNLTGANTYTGPTAISAGRLAVNGSITSNVSVGSGGNLGGSGTIFGAVANAGTMAPGNSIGTINIAGSFTQNPGSAYQAEVNAGGQADRISVSGAPGTAVLNGGTVAVLAAAGNYAPSTTYTILTASGGVSGAYASSFTNFPFLQSSLSYDPNNVYLTVAPGGFARGAATVNQAAVGGVLDRSVAGSSGDFATVIGALSTQTVAQGRAAMDAVSGQNYSGFATAGIANSLGFMNVLGQQMSLARGGPGTGTRLALGEACDVACDGEPPNPFTIWGSALGVTGSVAGGGGASTLSYTSGGVATGIDYRVDPGLLVGLGLGFATGSQYLGGFSGRGTTDSYQGTLYASFTRQAFYLDALAGFGFSNDSMQRQIFISGLQPRTALGRTTANQFIGQVEAGYAIGLHLPSMARITPFARLQGVSNDQAGFSETGASSLSLTVAQQTTSSLRSTIGADFAGAFDLGWRDRLALRFRLGWAHEYADVARPVTASFAGAPAAAFTVFGAAPQRDAAVIGLAASTAIAATLSLYLRYDGEIGSGGDNHALSAGFRMTW